ncbi:hypothetical protein [Kitasatospora sp. NPDC057015]|uniref:hypothetical protein n=1 Tax=Kitasatospora sp. NPDC057015 TaxID=3346001 RepID=UPI00363447A0
MSRSVSQAGFFIVPPYSPVAEPCTLRIPVVPDGAAGEPAAEPAGADSAGPVSVATDSVNGASPESTGVCRATSFVAGLLLPLW